MGMPIGIARRLWLSTLLLGGCATAPVPQPAAPLTQHMEAGARTAGCAGFLTRLDREVEEAGVADTQAVRIPGFPYLRVNRLLASFRNEVEGPERFAAWVDRLQRLDRTGRRLETANLPPERLRRVRLSLPEGYAGIGEAVTGCGGRLRAEDLTRSDRRALLRQRARVPDEYRTGWRIAGLYPLSALAVRAGVSRYHAGTRAVFAAPLESLPRRGELVRYRPPRDPPPPGPAEIRRLLIQGADDPLGIPEPSPHRLDRLFAAFAPVFEVDTVTRADRLGTPAWESADRPTVDTASPAVYRLVSHTRFHGRVLLQLNYVAWFPARPRTGPWDLLGGHMDGVTWRVTLGTDGRALLYDVMHNCGCYHMYFPTAHLRRRDGRTPLYQEPPLIPQEGLAVGPPARPVIRLSHRTHYVRRVHDGTAVAVPPRRRAVYAVAPYDRLRSLPAATGGRRSLFRPDGIVPGTERRERYLFWPTGVPAPGAMRQWGHHAVAFVGRRHFDDPFLLERLFEPVEGAVADGRIRRGGAVPPEDIPVERLP